MTNCCPGSTRNDGHPFALRRKQKLFCRGDKFALAAFLFFAWKLMCTVLLTFGCIHAKKHPWCQRFDSLMDLLTFPAFRVDQCHKRHFLQAPLLLPSSRPPPGLLHSAIYFSPHSPPAPQPQLQSVVPGYQGLTLIQPGDIVWSALTLPQKLLKKRLRNRHVEPSNEQSTRNLRNNHSNQMHRMF